jgi:uncharacterized protein (DUF983 family)
MRRQCCSGCGSAIGMKQYYKALSYAVTCDKCGHRHGVKPGSRWAVALLIGIAPIVNLYVKEWLNPDLAWYVPLVIVYIAVIYALLPWLLKVVPEDKNGGGREQREYRG